MKRWLPKRRVTNERLDAWLGQAISWVFRCVILLCVLASAAVVALDVAGRITVSRYIPIAQQSLHTLSSYTISAILGVMVLVMLSMRADIGQRPWKDSLAQQSRAHSKAMLGVAIVQTVLFATALVILTT